MDKKTTIIYILIAIIIFLIAFIGASKYNQVQIQKQQLAFQQGLQQGQLNEQRNAISQIQTTGIYSIPIIDENNETQFIRLQLAPQETIQTQTEE